MSRVNAYVNTTQNNCVYSICTNKICAFFDIFDIFLHTRRFIIFGSFSIKNTFPLTAIILKSIVSAPTYDKYIHNRSFCPCWSARSYQRKCECAIYDTKRQKTHSRLGGNELVSFQCHLNIERVSSRWCKMDREWAFAIRVWKCVCAAVNIFFVAVFFSRIYSVSMCGVVHETIFFHSGCLEIVQQSIYTICSK